MESFSRKTRSVDCEENTTLLASDSEELALNGMVNVSEPCVSVVTGQQAKGADKLEPKWYVDRLEHCLLALTQTKEPPA
jgi:hypothetical protein